MEQRTKITLAWELYEQGLSQTQIAKRLEVNRETANRWVKSINEQGLLPFLESFAQQPQKPRPKRQTLVSVKQKVWMIREREEDCCGQKIAYFLQKEHDITLSVAKIYEILAEKYALRSKWKKNQKRGEVPEATAPRQVIQMDTVDFGHVFAFTAVDIFSREADIYVAGSLTSEEGKQFLLRCMPPRFTGRSELIQTDGGSEFEGEFGRTVGDFCDYHRVSRPYKKNEQSDIESFNRTVRKECLGWRKYKEGEREAMQAQADAFLDRYHYHRPHMGFDPMRPPLSR